MTLRSWISEHEWQCQRAPCFVIKKRSHLPEKIRRRYAIRTASTPISALISMLAIYWGDCPSKALSPPLIPTNRCPTATPSRKNRFIDPKDC